MDITAILRQRDRASFDWLYSQYAGILLGIIRKRVEENAVAESLLQETFVEAWKSLDEFDAKAVSLFIWMLRIARAKADEYKSDQEDQQPKAPKKKFWTSSAHRQATGQKQYSNW